MSLLQVLSSTWRTRADQVVLLNRQLSHYGIDAVPQFEKVGSDVAIVLRGFPELTAANDEQLPLNVFIDGWVLGLTFFNFASGACRVLGYYSCLRPLDPPREVADQTKDFASGQQRFHRAREEEICEWLDRHPQVR